MKTTLEQIKERWIDYLAIAIASASTTSVVKWLGWSDSFWIYILVFIAITILVGIITGIILSIIKKIKV